MHFLRGLAVVFANLTFSWDLLRLPLAEATAIFFVSPLLITVFSIFFLKERVGIHRWGSVVFGLIGVLIILRPGTEAFKFASLLPIAAAVGYATLHMLTRHLGKTESALTMSFYIQITFIFICRVFWLFVGDGRFVMKQACIEFSSGNGVSYQRRIGWYLLYWVQTTPLEANLISQVSQR